MITVPVCIEKLDVSPVAALKGATNEDHCVINGEDYAPRSLVFRGFAGTLDSETRKYVGVYRFDQRADSDSSSVTMVVADLPDVENKLTTSDPRKEDI